MRDFNRALAGPWLFGLSLDFFLFSILTVQIYVYYLAFPKDRVPIKLAVAWVYLVGTAQTVLAMTDLYNAFNDSLGDNFSSTLFGSRSHPWLTVIASSAVVALIAQWLYAYRIYVISRKRWILVLIISLSLGQLGTSIIGCICLLSFHFPMAPYPGGADLCLAGFEYVWGPLNFLCDAIITLSMSVLLLKRRRGTLKKTTHARISRVVRLMVETNLATSVAVVVYTTTYDLAGQDLTFSITAWLIPGLAIGKVYSNSMLALLNSRLTIVGGRNTGDPFGISEIRSEVLRTNVEER